MWAVDEPGHELGVASIGPGAALVLASILASLVALAVVPALASLAPVTLQSVHFEQLTSAVAGLVAVVGGVKFLAMAGGVTARFLARPPSAVAISPGD